MQNSTEQEVPASEKVKVLTTPYPTTPPITDFFMQVNEKRFYPDTVMIKKGHSVTIMNIGKSVTTVTPSVADSDHDFGEIKESEERVIQFNKAGVYRYTRSTKPDQVLTITVTE
jgi:plastocyanin